jgi:hypothetical protein
MKQEVIVTKIDAKMIADIESAYKALHASTDAENELILNLNNASGDIEKAFQAAEIMHSELNKGIFPLTKASGTLDTAGTLLFAVGYPGMRTAKPATQFKLNEDSRYKIESKVEDLEGSDAIVYDTLCNMLANKKMVFDKIKSGGKFSATASKKMKIVDEIDSFKNVFAPLKTGGKDRKKQSSKMDDAATINSDRKEKPSEKNHEPDQKEDSKIIQSNSPLKRKKS